MQVVGHGTQGQKTTKTDANGDFTFTDLTPGTYTVKVNLPAHWHYTTSNATGQRVTLQPGALADPIEFGQTNAATVSGSVFLDANKNGKREAREQGLADWIVTLTANGSSVPSFTTTTDAKGNYSFTGIPVGIYQIGIVEAAGYSPSGKAKVAYPLPLPAWCPGKNFSPSNLVWARNWQQGRAAA